MRWARVARALIKPLISLANSALSWTEAAHKKMLGLRYRLIKADMRLAAKETVRKLDDLLEGLKEGKLCGYAEELGMGSDDIIEYLEAKGCRLLRIIDFGDMINTDYMLGCPKLRREVSVSSNVKIREWVCVSWSEESEERLRYEGEPEIVYVDDP